MAIVGKLDEATLARRIEQGRRAKVRERQAQAAESFIRQSPFAGLADISSSLRKEREENTRRALSRRNESGRFVSRAAQAEAQASADKLEKLGY